MDTQLIISYAKKLKIALIILFVGLIIFGVLIKKLIPEITNFISQNKEISALTTSIDEDTKKLAELKKSFEQTAKQDTHNIKEIFKPVDLTISAESAITEEFGDILKIIRANSIKVRSVKYSYNPSDDNFVKNAANKYNVCALSLEMIGDYKHFQAFLRDLYKHEHLIDISVIEISPYEKDKKILLIKSVIKLYSLKNDSTSNVQKMLNTQEETKDDVSNEEVKNET